MRLLQLGMHWFPERQGGLDRVFYELYRTLPHAGVAVRGLVAGSPQVAEETEGRINAFARADAPLPHRLLAMRRAFTTEIDAYEPDLIGCHFALYALPLLNRLTRHPTVLHFHGPWAEEGIVEGDQGPRTTIKRIIERLVYRRSVRAIVLSRAFGDVLASRYGFNEALIDVVPGGIDSGRFAVAASRAEARLRLGWPERPTVLAVRRLVPRMGLEPLIDGFAQLRRQVPDAQLMIVGRGRLQQQLAARIDANGISSHARLLGYVPDVDLPLVYRAADVSVVPSTTLEGFGLTAAESLAAGTPCLVAPVGGLPEVVEGLSPNLILPDTRPQTLARCLADALKGSKLPEDARCRAYAADQFDWSVIARATASTYRGALA